MLTDGRTDRWTDGRTENWKPIWHPATSRCDKKYTGCNLKTTEFLDCALIGVCAVIRSNTVYMVLVIQITCTC